MVMMSSFIRPLFVVRLFFLFNMCQIFVSSLGFSWLFADYFCIRSLRGERAVSKKIPKFLPCCLYDTHLGMSMYAPPSVLPASVLWGGALIPHPLRGLRH